MAEKNLILIEGFTRKRENGVIDTFQILVSENSIYLINSSANYGNYVKSIFDGIGEVFGLFGETIGFIGGLTSEITGTKLSKVLKEYSDKSSNKNLDKLKKNLDKIAAKKKGITKIDFSELDAVNVKKGYLINGKSFVEFTSNELIMKLISN